MHPFFVTPDLFRGPLRSKAKAARLQPEPPTFRLAARWMPDQVRHDGVGKYA
jgi:hypothetical protein